MLDKIITFALTQRLLIAFATLCLIVAGIWAVYQIPIDSFPDVSNVQVQVITEPERMATEEVETLVTFPIETSLNGLPKIKQIRSNSSFGLSVVTAIFDDDADVYFCRQLVYERVNQMNFNLPEGDIKPILGPVLTSFSNVFMYYLWSDRYDLTDLRTMQDWLVARRLRAVRGVGNVVSYGGYVKQYQVLVSPNKLRGYGLTVADVIHALSENNANAGGNFIEQGGEEIIIRGLGRIQKESDIGNIVLKSVAGTPVKVSNVADIVIGSAFRRGSASMDGKGEVVTGIVQTRKGVNTKASVEAIRREINKIQKDLPEGVKIVPYYDQADLVNQTIETVKEILIFSSGLVVIVLMAMLMHIRSAVIVCVIIPLSLLFSFIMMKMTGLSANLMTLGAVDFGVIVDSGVVMVENIYRHLAEASHSHQGKRIDTWKVILEASKEVGRPIFFAIGIIISVYIPLFTLEGVEGKMFHPLALSFIYAITGALIVSLTIIPVLCFWAMKKPLVERESPILTFAKRHYTPILKSALKYPQKTMSISVLALVGSLLLVPLLGSEFVPTLDEGPILLRTKLSASVSHTESRRIASVVEKMIKRFPEVTEVVSRIGRSGMGSDLDGVDNADVYIGLKPKSEWKTTHNKEELINKMAAELDKIPGLVYSFSQPIADMIDDLIAGIKADLGIKIFGDDIYTIDSIAGKIQNVVSGVKGSADMQREHILGLPQLNIKIKRDEIARHGINVSDIQAIIESAVAGEVVTQVIEGTKRFGLLVRFPFDYRDNIEDIQNILVSTPDGGKIPLKQLADFELDRGLVMLNREDGQRRTAVLANVRGRDLGSFVAEAQAKVAQEVDLPKGYYIVWGGQFENQQRAMARLCIVVPVVLLLIFILLFVTFNSLKNAGLIMMVVPFSLIGGILALFITRQVLSVPAVIGFIALFGVAVQNGVILVSYIMQLQKHGYPVQEAVLDGAHVRLRPVLMTALVAIMGLIPKVLSSGTGAEIQRPLATVVLGGLISATILTLVVLPALYELFNQPEEEKVT